VLVTVSMILKVNDVKLWVEKQGKGQPFVLCHGGPGAYDYLAPIANMVDDICTVIRYDQRGSGRSQHVGPYDVQTHINDLEALRQQLNITSWIVGGHSWGASLALAYSTRFPQYATALIYISGTGINPQWHDVYQQNCLLALNEAEREKCLLLNVRLEQSSEEAYDKIRQELQMLLTKTDFVDPGNIDKGPYFNTHGINNKVNHLVNIDWEAYMVRPEFLESLRHLPIPVLFLHGRQDPRSMVFVEELASYVPEGKFISIPNAGHYPYIEQPEQTRDTLREFIQQKVRMG